MELNFEYNMIIVCSNCGKENSKGNFDCWNCKKPIQ